MRLETSQLVEDHQNALMRIAMILFCTASVSTYLYCQEKTNSPPDSATCVSANKAYGWVELKEEGNERRELISMANHSKHEWEVKLDPKCTEGVRIEPWHAAEAMQRNPLPFPIPWCPRDPETERFILDGRCIPNDYPTPIIALQVNDGWLVGFDEGEFGGGLYWADLTGQNWKLLSADNTIALITHPLFGILAFQGLAHLGEDRGSVLRILHQRRHGWRGEKWLRLPEAPQAVFLQHDGVIFIVGNSRITKLDGRKRLLEVARLPEYLYPNSIVMDEKGALWVGMRHFVFRSTIETDGWKSSLWVPEGCLEVVTDPASLTIKCRQPPEASNPPLPYIISNADKGRFERQWNYNASIVSRYIDGAHYKVEFVMKQINYFEDLTGVQCNCWDGTYFGIIIHQMKLKKALVAWNEIYKTKYEMLVKKVVPGE